MSSFYISPLSNFFLPLSLTLWISVSIHKSRCLKGYTYAIESKVSRRKEFLRATSGTISSRNLIIEIRSSTTAKLLDEIRYDAKFRTVVGRVDDAKRRKWKTTVSTMVSFPMCALKLSVYWRIFKLNPLFFFAYIEMYVHICKWRGIP